MTIIEINLLSSVMFIISLETSQSASHAIRH